MKKQIRALFLAGCMLVSLFLPVFASADNIASGTCGNHLTWVLDSNGTLTVSGTGDMTDYQQVGYGNTSPWYSHAEKIKKVVIENGVTHVGNESFSYLDNLTTVTVAGSVLSIGDDAFGENGALSSVTLNEGLRTIGDGAFLEADRITTFTFPNTVTSIGIGVLAGCDKLTTVVLSDHLRSIPKIAFFNSTQMKSIYIPASVTSIAGDAFYSCRGLDNVFYSGTEEQWARISKAFSAGILDQPDEPTPICEYTRPASAESLEHVVGVLWKGLTYAPTVNVDVSGTTIKVNPYSMVFDPVSVNPYGLTLSAATRGETDGEFYYTPMIGVNTSNVPLEMSMSATVIVPDSVKLVTNPAKVENTSKNGGPKNVFLEIVTAITDSDGSMEISELGENGTVSVSGISDPDPRILIVKSSGTAVEFGGSKKNPILLEEGSSQANYFAVCMCGGANWNLANDDVWRDTDNISAIITMSFKPLARSDS